MQVKKQICTTFNKNRKIRWNGLQHFYRSSNYLIVIVLSKKNLYTERSY